MTTIWGTILLFIVVAPVALFALGLFIALFIWPIIMEAIDIIADIIDKKER